MPCLLLALKFEQTQEHADRCQFLQTTCYRCLEFVELGTTVRG
jgi:hypothetical protein